MNKEASGPFIFSRRGHYFRIEPFFQERNFVFDDKLVFVLMPFGEPRSDRIWEKLSEIVTKQGLHAERADNRYGPIIIEDIWSGLVESRLIICDVTGWNPNVFYELGIAHTLGKDVILITQQGTPFPFDTQGLRHLIYTDNPKGMRLLEEELPKMIEFYLQQRPKIRRARLKFPKPKKTELKAAWAASTKDWDPKLPPEKYGLQRGQMGVLRSRMMLCIWGHDNEDVNDLMKEIRESWPQSWDDMDEDEIKEKCARLQGIVAKMELKSFTIRQRNLLAT